MKRSKKNQSASFTTRAECCFLFNIAAFIALVFFLVQYGYVVPVQKSVE